MIGRPSDAAEDAQGKLAARLGADDPARALAGGFGAGEDLTREPSLANPPCTNDHRAATITNSAERAPDGTQFAIASGQRVAGGHGPVADAKAGSICRAESLRRFERGAHGRDFPWFVAGDGSRR